VKNFKRLSILLVLAMLVGLLGVSSPVKVEAQQPTTRMTVLELRSSPT
jgi:hypothetical protein